MFIFTLPACRSENIFLSDWVYDSRRQGNENETPVEVFFDDFKVEHKKSPVVQMDDYYPFGLTFNSYQRENSLTNQYQYNGKEIQDELDLGWLDYGARIYMPEIGRFSTLDPLADEFANYSPFSYSFNNPVRYTDYMGMEPEDEVKKDREEYSYTVHTIEMTWNEKENTNTITETVSSYEGKFQTDGDGNTTWVESTSTSSTSETIDSKGKSVDFSQSSSSSTEVFKAKESYEPSANPAEGSKVTFSKGESISKTSSSSNASFAPSKHFKDLVSVAIEFVSSGFGPSYNFRVSESLGRNSENVELGTGKGFGLAKALIGLAERYTQTYFYNRTGWPPRGNRTECSIPHDGKVPMSYRNRAWNEKFKN